MRNGKEYLGRRIILYVIFICVAFLISSCFHSSNHPPTANAGVDQVVPSVGSVITLDGSLSSDVDGDKLKFQWEIDQKPFGSVAELSDPTDMQPTLTIDVDGRYGIKLVVSDGSRKSKPDFVYIHTENLKPTGDIKSSKPTLGINYVIGDKIELDASGSTDPENQTLYYRWEIITPAESQSVLDNDRSVAPSFIVDKVGTYIVHLVVEDGVEESLVITTHYVVVNPNDPPIAIAEDITSTSDGIYTIGDILLLDGSDSFDPEGKPLFFLWEFVDKPAGSLAEFENGNSMNPRFVADMEGRYIVQLVVDDGINKSEPSVAVVFNVIVANDPPIAIAKDITEIGGANYVVGDTLVLNGSESFDPEGAPLSYRWAIIEKPPNSLTELDSNDAVHASFKVDFPGHYIIHLIVDDGVKQSEPSSVIYEIVPAERRSDTRPFAEAGPDQPLYEASTVVLLDGTLSYDLENDQLSYRWEMIAKPEASAAQLSDVTAPRPEFLADILGSYVVKLVVSDINGESHLDTVVITPHEDPKLACGDCHNNLITRGKALDHLLNYDDCAACHFTSGFLPTKGSFHAHGHQARPSQCAICHDGVVASTKPVDHIEANNDCNACHIISDGTWVPALRVPGNPGFSHSGIYAGCDDCHNSIIERGKPEGHIPSSIRCNACHATNAWLPARHLEHTQALGPCRNCHDPDQDQRVQPPDHLKTTNNCLACHTDADWVPVLRVDHVEVIGSCASCHDGVVAQGKGATHVESSTFCDKCHGTLNWVEISAGHDFFTGACVDCHNGVVSTGASPSHELRFTSLCESCHNVINWLPDVVDHTQALGTCHGCHDQPGGGFQSGIHIPSTNQCDMCHSTVTWLPVITVDHSQVIGACTDCHNNLVAKWKTSLHIYSDNTCEACHTAVSFAPAITVDHNLVLGECAGCHDGVMASGVNAAHIPSSSNCGACHSTTGFIPAISIDHNETVGACVDCHNGVIATGKVTGHMATSDRCEKCHSTTAMSPVNNIDHAHVIGDCVSCHNSFTAIGMPSSHTDPVLYPNSDNCMNCHSTFRWLISVFPAGHDLEVIGCSVSGCHDGIAAPDQPLGHIDSTAVCEACHSHTRFSPAILVDHSQVVGTCSDCHNGIVAAGQAAAHIATSNVCEACHNHLGWIPVSAVDHSEVRGDCFSCHNDINATGKGSTHPPSDNVCENCHYLDIWVPATLSVVGHRQLAPTTCVSAGCHQIGINHAPTVTEDCSSCHVVAGWLNWARPTTQRAP